MIHKAVKFRANNKEWWHQLFTPDRFSPEYAIRLYDQQGNFVKEFTSFDQMNAYINKKDEGSCQKMMYNGKEVHTPETFSFSEIKIGDLVSQEVVDDILDMLPPACMRSDCSQIGEPYSHRQDPDTGKFRATYETFTRIAGRWPDAIWEYRGRCFRGENVERGADPQYC